VNCTVLLSGGVDSAAGAASLQRKGHVVGSVFIDYGQAAGEHERAAAAALAEHLALEHRELRIDGLAVPVGEIPGRNALLVHMVLTTAVAGGAIVLGIHAGTNFRDCSPAFVAAMQDSLDFHTGGSVRLLAPFITMRKPEVFDLAVYYGVPLHLTRSCEAAAAEPCGRCRSCLDMELLGASR